MGRGEERLTSAKPHEQVVGKIVGVSNCDAVMLWEEKR